MVVGSRLDYKILAQPFTPDKSEYIAVLHPSWTTANLADATHRVNVQDKFLGRPAWNSTIGEPVYASGPDPSDAWVSGFGTVAETVANLSDKADTINTVGKYVGKLVYDTAGGLLYAADGVTDVSTWTLIDGVGSTQTTPS